MYILVAIVVIISDSYNRLKTPLFAIATDTTSGISLFTGTLINLDYLFLLYFARMNINKSRLPSKFYQHLI